MTRPKKPAKSSAVHISVMRDDTLAALAPRDGECFIDATFGAGGYTTAILNAAPDTHVIAFDRDPEARARFEKLDPDLRARITFVDAPFSTLASVLDMPAHARGVDGVVFDLGVSSPQIDTPERGFSFRADGPLDMRMDPRGGQTAADLVNTLPEQDLANLIYEYGEERKSRAIARAIVATRQKDGPITTTAMLADIIRRVMRPGPKDTIDPCTRTFQALRIAVNRELDELRDGIFAAVSVLKPNGRLVIVSFHSLEDRIVKQVFTELSGRSANPSRHVPSISADVSLPPLRIINPRATAPQQSETEKNIRARSARMRVAIRTDTPLPSSFGSTSDRTRLS